MFLSLGFKSVTMDDISKNLGISKKTIYTHFSNKTELVRESTSFMFEHIESGIKNICTQNLNAIEELFEIKQFVLKTLKDEESSPQYQLEKFFPDIHQKFKNRHLAVVNECICKNIEKGIKDDLYRTDLDPQFISRIYYIGITGVKDEETFPKTMYTQKQLMGKFLNYHIRSIATEKGLETLNTILNTNKN